VALTIGFAPSAGASTTIGQLAPGTADGVCSEQFDALQVLIHRSSDYVVTEEGVITSWSTNARAGAGQMMTFKVFRQNGAGGFTVIAHDGPRALSPLGINTFKVRIPVKVSDFIGVNTANASPITPSACVWKKEEEGTDTDDVLFAFPGDAADGATLPAKVENRGVRLNLSATVLPPPEINLFGRVALGPITGGGKVVFQGLHFEEVSKVAFGGVEARKFSVDDDHQITAIAPPGKTLNEIPVSVTTPAGTVVSPSILSYSGCLVPKLKGKKLKAAKARIKRAGCKLGKVKRVRGPAGKRGKVVQQSPKPGKVGAPGTKVSVKVGS
jgi:hypothetical protein